MSHSAPAETSPTIADCANARRGPRKVLLVEDHEPTLWNLADSLERRGHTVTLARTQSEARTEIHATAFDIALLDVVIPGGSALELLPQVAMGSTRVILMSGETDVQQTLARLEHCNLCFVPKPVDLDELFRLIADHPAPGAGLALTHDLIGDDPTIAAARDQITRAATDRANVLIVGESGSGRDTAAAFYRRVQGAAPPARIHAPARGARCEWIDREPSDCIYIDDLTAFRLADQQRIAGWIREHPTLPWIASVTGGLDSAIRAHRLHPEVRAALGAVTIELPPLRRRQADIPLLVAHFASLAQHSRGFDPSALAALENYHWPGNVRQLHTETLRACSRSGGDSISRAHLSPAVSARTPGSPDLLSLPVGGRLENAERDLIQACLSAYHGDRRATAAALGISLRTLYNRLSRYGWRQRSDAKHAPSSRQI